MNDLIEQLKRHEGLKLKPYKCTVGKLTIGYGRNLDDVGITEREANDMLENDTVKVKCELEFMPWYMQLDSVRKDCIVNMAFNMGTPTLYKFTKMINALSLRDYGLAAKEMLNSKWARQVGDRASELAEQMRTGKYKGDL